MTWNILRPLFRTLWLRQATLAFLVAVPFISFEVMAGGRPVDFTPEERQQFVDAPTRYPRAALPLVAHAAATAAWLDNNRIIYSTREIIGRWRAGPEEMAKVIIFDVRNGSVEETGYRGNLACYSADKILVVHPKFGKSTGFNPQLDALLEGRLGQPLKPVADLEGKEILRYSCELNPIVKWLTPRDEVTDVPLLPGHGFLRLPRGVRRVVGPGKEPRYELFDASGRFVDGYAGNGYPLQTQLHYLPWQEAYFANKGTSAASETLTPAGERHILDVPSMLVAWSVHSNVGSGAAVATRIGVAWNFGAWPAYWRMQGLYLQRGPNTLMRVDDAHIPGIPGVVVSRDGCRLFYMRRPGHPHNASQPFQPTVMTLCEGEGK